MRLIPSRRPFRVTVLRQLGGIGDVLMLTPVFRGLKEAYPGCHLTVATSWVYKAGCLPAILKGNPHIDRVVRVEPHEWVTGWMRAARWDFRGVPSDNPPQCVIDTDLVIELAVICAVTETATQPNVTKHRTDIWCEAAGVNPSSKKPVLILTEAEYEEGRRWVEANVPPGRRIGLVLNAHCPIRSWPQIDAFARDLVQAGHPVVTFDAVKRLAEEIPACIGKTIRQVAAVIAHLDLVVSPDSGLLHVAGTMGTPVVGLFGSTNGDLRMREYCGSYTQASMLASCGPCWYVNKCLQDPHPEQWVRCMQRITRELVMEEVEQTLARFPR